MTLRGFLRRSWPASVAMGLLASAGARAQSFDCAKAASPVEQAICASPDLRTADEALSRAYMRALAGADAEGAAHLRSSQRTWSTERNACAQAAGDIGECLAKSYRARTSALSALAAATPALPPGPPPGAASLSQTSVPAAGDHDALLTVSAPGRFAIRATSKTGVALQLVDMISGPGEIAGDPGVRDGRLDVPLDKGVYKLRLTGAKIASGDAALSVAPFAPLATADSRLLRGGETSGALGDLQQRSFWVFADSRKRLSVDAVGRSLRDLRAWRNGTDLLDLEPDPASAEPKPGHPLTRLRLDGAVEPGLYLVTAYGGEALPWSDSDNAQPFFVQAFAPAFLPSGSIDAVIGPSGTLRYTLPGRANYARIELPDVAPTRLTIRDRKNVLATASIAKNNREPVAATSFSSSDDVVAEITGQAGQRVRLRALTTAASSRADDPGPHIVSVDVAGDGGDEIPATAVFARFDKTSAKANAQVLASTALRVAPGQAWRRKFNLRGSSTLLVEIAGAGPVAARAQGIGVRLTLEPLLGSNAPRADGKRPRQWDVEAGFYTLKIDPVAGAVGILDLTFGQPDLAVDVAPSTPPRDAMDFGLVNFDRLSAYQLLLNSAPGLVTAPRIRALPADLAAGALAVTQAAKQAAVPAPTVAPAPAPPPAATPVPPPKPRAASQGAAPKPAVPKPAGAKPPAGAITAARPAVAAKPLPPKPAPVLAAPSIAADRPLVLPVRAPAGGTISVTDAGGHAVAFTKSADTIEKNLRTATITIQPADAQRRLVIAWTPARANEPLPPLPGEGEEPRIAAGKPFFFDLGKDDRKSFALDVADGGLYRVETLGRLKTTASIGTRFLPKIDDAEDNGPGHNALIQTWLRGGAYRVNVSAQESEGHLGLVARPAPLIDGGVVPVDGSARATLAEGAGASFVFDIADAGDYRLDLYGLDQTFTARLEDSEGWPLARPGELPTLTRRFEKGRYRLVVMPPDVEAQIVVRLRRKQDTKQPEGHGPHALPFDATTSAQWREPAGKDAPRTPDRWEFTLAGAAKITLSTSDGMTGDLLGPDGKSLARLAKDRPFSAELAAGRYAVEMRALGRDDRLDYTLELQSEALQPGRPRFVELPATIPFSIAQDRIVGLTTFGERQLTGVLRNEAGEALERLSGRSDDWNLALSRRLPAGRYTLDLAALQTPGASSDGDGESTDNADDPPRAKEAAAEDAQQNSEQAAADNADDDRAKVEVRLALPDEQAAKPLALSGTTPITGNGATRLALPALDAGTLLLVAAQADAEIVLSLERRDASGRTTVTGFSRGRMPIVAMPVGAQTREGWELAVWSIDGGNIAATLAARAMTMQAQDGNVSLADAGSESPLKSWRVGHAATRGKTVVKLPARTPGLLTGSTFGRPLSETETGILAPQGDSVWFVAPAAVPETVAVSPLGDASDLALTLDTGDVATLPVAKSNGRLRVWRADATDGQPGLLAANGAGVAPGTAFALGDGAVSVWNAGSAAPLALRVKARDVTKLQGVEAGESKALAIPAASAQPLRLASGNKRVALELAAGVAAVLSGGEATRVVWAGDIARSAELAGGWSDVLFVNTTDAPAPAKVASVPAAAATPLAAGHAFKQFFGAAGSFAIAIDGKTGDRLTVAGGDGTFVGADGRVARGAALALPGPGVLTIDHPPGLVVAAIENGETTPWTAPKASAAKLPASMSLAGASMALALHVDAPMLLRIRTSAPVVMALRQSGSGDPEPMPLGADIRRYIAAGDAELRLFSAHDGPLSGTLDLSAEPVTPIGDGIGEAQIVAPAGRALFAFEVERAGMIGVGVRAEPDRVSVRLLDAKGAVLGDGVAQLRKLDKGRYVLEARAPADGPTITVRPAVIGLKPRPGGPPPDVAAKYLELVGMKAKR